MKRIASVVLVLVLILAWNAAALASEFLVESAEPAQAGSTAVPEASSSPVGTEAAVSSPTGPQAAEYESARRMLEKGDLITAINAFAKLSQYEDAALYTAYLEAKLNLLRNTPGKALEGFSKLGTFLDSAALAARAQALYCHRFQQGQLFGFVDGSGETVAQASFDWAERSFRPESAGPGAAGQESLPVVAVFMGGTFCDGTDLLPGKGQFGLLRRDGELVVPPAYDEILWTVGGLAALRSGQVFTLVDLQTGRPLGGSYEDIGAYAEGFIPVKAYGKWGYLSREGRMLPGDFAWDSALPFREGMAGVSQDKRAGFIDSTGKVAVPLAYDAVGSFGDGLAGVRQGKKWGFVNTRGELVIKPAFSQVGVFAWERCRVQRSGKWGIINSQGEWVVPYKYDEITEYDPIYHRAWMRNNKLWGLLSLDGVVLKPTWATFTPFAADGMSAVSYKGSYGYIDTRGVNRIPNGFGKASAFSAGMGGVLSQEGRVEYLNKLGRGFAVASHVPTQPLNGFLEGRIVAETPVCRVDPDTGKRTQASSYSISFLLYDLEGKPMDIR